ncbi:MAG TPA: ChaB family protein [Candidatus Acidoferrales bacterium]|nr:ChaB family protein [Candidatus Acidoferrales bacterium]
MPYSANTELPEAVRSVLPEEAQSIWRNAFNSAVYDQELSEERAFQVAWAAVENAGYEKGEDGRWIKKQMQGVGLLAAIALASLGSELEQPVRVRVNALGKWVHPVTGTFEVSADDVSNAVREFKARKNPLAVDYEHQTYQNPPVEAPAAGWVSDIADLGKGVFEYVISFTKRAAEKIKSGEYKFLSPVLFKARDRNTNKPIGMIFGVPALTNNPFFYNEQEPIKLNFGIAKESTMKEFLKKLFAKLGINASEDISEDKAIELIAAAAGKPAVVASKGILATLELPETATEDEIRGKILALKKPGDVVPMAQYRRRPASPESSA